MFEYLYTREIVDDAWNVDNCKRVDDNKNQIRLEKEVEKMLPGKAFKMFCNAADVKFIFNAALAENEKSILDSVVYSHKHNL